MKRQKLAVYILIVFFAFILVSSCSFFYGPANFGQNSGGGAVAPLDSNSDLSSLSLSDGVLTPIFDPNTTYYTSEVQSIVSSIILTPAAAGINATISANGQTLLYGASSQSINLNAAGTTTTITVKVTAESGNIKNYTLVISRLSGLSSNANLAGIYFSSSSLAPAFDQNIISYTSQVSISVGSVYVIPTAAGVGAAITVNGQSVASGAQSQALVLNPGLNTITIAVTAQDLSTSKSYTVALSALSSNANLSALTVSSGVLTPGFNTSTAAYNAEVNKNTTSVTVTATAQDINAAVTINGQALTSLSVPLSQGANSITILVTAQDNITVKNYNINVYRLTPTVDSSNTNLASLILSVGSISPSFDPVTTYYTDQVPNGAFEIYFTPTASGVNAAITVDSVPVASGATSQAVSLNVGLNTIIVMVAAENGSVKNYTVDITRL